MRFCKRDRHWARLRRSTCWRRRMGPEKKSRRITEKERHIIAYHEVGHAIQDKQNSPLLSNRTRWVEFAQFTDRLGSLAMIAMPFLALLSKSPALAGLIIFLAVGSMLVTTIVHFITLPVGLDASFKKALPILKEGEYIEPEDEKAVNAILKAAAYTYVAASLASLLNLARWIAIFRR